MPISMRRIDPIKTVYEFSVKGRGQFPFDMLRYDQCWPKAEAGDVPSLVHGVTDERTVNLVGISPPTSPRWASFGWTVL